MKKILTTLLLLCIGHTLLFAQQQESYDTDIRSELGLDDDVSAATLPDKPTFQIPDTTFPLGWIPQKTRHLVNDYTGILNSEQYESLESRLVEFDNTTSNQIMILITPDLGGNDIAQFTQDVWDVWGVGSKKHDNGVIIVVKPKNRTKGQVRIHTGYGLEGALPDLFCSKIIENEMIPCFKENDYYGGIVAALDIILPVCQGEYDEERYDSDNDIAAATLAFIVCFVILCFILIVVSKNSNSNSNDGSMPPYFGSSMGRSTGSWGTFSSGGGFGGGGFSGGFGGFGGGFSGGGGASGSW